jgi:hypothetical protein
MVPIFVILTVLMCIGIKSLAQRGRQTHAETEKKTGRIGRWRLTEEAF